MRPQTSSGGPEETNRATSSQHLSRVPIRGTSSTKRSRRCSGVARIPVRRDYPARWRVELHLKPGSYKAGAETRITGHRPNTPCCTAVYEAGSDERLSRGRNLTWANGVEVGSIIGIDLSSRSGWTEEVAVQFWLRLGVRRICGSLNPPSVTSEPPGWLATHL
jgi:hypothetical protein